MCVFKFLYQFPSQPTPGLECEPEEKLGSLEPFHEPRSACFRHTVSTCSRTVTPQVCTAFGISPLEEPPRGPVSRDQKGRRSRPSLKTNLLFVFCPTLSSLSPTVLQARSTQSCCSCLFIRCLSEQTQPCFFSGTPIPHGPVALSTL